MLSLWTALLYGCGGNQDAGAQNVPPASLRPSDSPGHPIDPEPAPPPKLPLTLESYLARHQEREPDRQDLSLLFGSDLTLTAEDMARYDDLSINEIRDRFLTPDSELVKNVSVILAASASDADKLRGVKFFLSTDALPGGIPIETTDVDAIAPADSDVPTRTLSPDNPILELLDLEKSFRPDLKSRTIDYLTGVLNAVAAHVSDETPPRQCFAIAWRALFDTNVGDKKPVFAEPSSQLLSECLAEGRIDCDMTTFVLLAVAHEMKWPLRPVIATNHIFSSWEGIGYFNNGVFYPDLVAMGVRDHFSTPLNAEETRGLFGGNIGLQHLQKSERFTEGKEYELDRAISWLKKGAAACPQHFGMRSNLGAAYLQRNRHDEARQACESALKLNPDYVEARINLAEAFFRKGDREHCLEHLKKAVALCDRLESEEHSPYTPAELEQFRATAKKNIAYLESSTP